MDFIKKLLGRKKGGPSSSSTKSGNNSTTPGTIQKLHGTEDLLVKKQEHIQIQIDKQNETAKSLASKNKAGAKRALLKKHRLVKELEKVQGMLTNVEVQRETLEATHMNLDVIKTLGAAAGALKVAHKNLDVDKVHDIMDDIAEQRDIGEEINQAISQPIAFTSSGVDEEELEKELESLQQEEVDKALLEVGPPGQIDVDGKPVVPSPASGPEKAQTPASPESEEEKMLKELEEWSIA